MTPLVANLIEQNRARWDRHYTKPSKIAHAVASRLCEPAARTIYNRIASRTGVPWSVIAVIHEREANQHWGANIANGDPWNKITEHVPAGRGPFNSFEDAAYDALVNCPPFAAQWRDWSIGGMLTLLEQYNGLGYARRGLPSPYIWAGTDQYEKGKYIADGSFKADYVDKQLGCVALLDAMAVIISDSPTAAPEAVAPPEAPSPQPAPAAPPSSPSAAVTAAGGGVLVAAMAALTQVTAHPFALIPFILIGVAVVAFAIYKLKGD